MIADTSFLIDLIKEQNDALQKAKEIEGRNERLLITAPSVFELHSGLARSKYPEKERTAILAAFKDQSVCSLSEAAAEAAGEIHGASVRAGKTMGIIDSLIAGIAKHEHEAVLTRNVKDFKKVPGLLVETY
jgi:predicted nucleic acid-binding protein